MYIDSFLSQMFHCSFTNVFTTESIEACPKEYGGCSSRRQAPMQAPLPLSAPASSAREPLH